MKPRLAVVLWNEHGFVMIRWYASPAEQRAAWDMAGDMDGLWRTNCEIRMWPEDEGMMPEHVAARVDAASVTGERVG